MPQCIVVKIYRRFGAAFYLNLAYSLLFYTEDGGDMTVSVYQTTRCHIPEENKLRFNLIQNVIRIRPLPA